MRNSDLPRMRSLLKMSAGDKSKNCGSSKI
jgi:hypothetical protein